MRAFPAVILGAGLLLSACAPSSDDGEKSSAPGLPLNYELAMAKTDNTAIASMVVDLSVEEVSAALANGSIRLIDVRTDEEVAEGMIPGAEHIALGRFDPAALDLSDGREVVLYCRSGRRSATVGEKLAAHTGEPVKHLAGGILAWQAAGEPVVLD